MGLLYEDQVAETLSGTTLTITPADNQSIRIKKIGFFGYSTETYANITIDRVKVGFVYPYYGGLSMFPQHVDQGYNINPYDNKNFDGIDLTYPVANGESFTITTSTSGNIYAVYDIYDAGDIKNTDPNGSHASIINFFQYLTVSSAITTATSEVFTEFNDQLNPSDFPNFPIDPVGAGQEIDVHAIGLQALARGNGGANQGYTEHLRLKYNREVLFDENGLGFLVRGDSTHTANSYDYVPLYNTVPYSQLYTPQVKKFSTPLTFKPGDELITEVSTKAGAAGTIEANKIIMWLLMTQRR